ncbi:hypothetical protein [Nostoc sp.]
MQKKIVLTADAPTTMLHSSWERLKTRTLGERAMSNQRSLSAI